MKLAYSNMFDTLALNSVSISTLVIENNKLFRAFVNDLYQQLSGNDGRFTLSENNKELNLCQCMEIITDPMAIDINTRKLQTKLYDLLNKDAVNEEYFMDTLELRQKVLAFAYKLLHGENLPLVLTEDFKLVDIFKLLEIKFENSREDLPMCLANYIDVHRNFLNIRILVLVNIKSYLTDEELLMLFNHASMRNLCLLLIENSCSPALKGECITIIDKDLCVVRKEF